MKILNFGSCNIDYVYSLDHIVVVGETETTHDLKLFPGGKGLNQSIALARAGAKVYHAGCVGSDGEMLTDILIESGVDVSFIKRVPEKNGHAIIQVSSNGENCIFLYPGSNDMITKEFVDSVLENFSAGDIILLQNEISNIQYIIKKAYERQMCIVLNPSPFNDVMKKINFNMISYLILNEVEAKEITSCEEPEESVVYFKNNYPNLKVMLTLGGNGCVYIDSENEIYQPAFEVEAVDTTAAGDAFGGYFVTGISLGDDYGEILKIASAAAAIAVTRNGAAPSIPEREEVLKTIKEFKFSKTNTKSDILVKEIEMYIDDNLKVANLEELSRKLGYSVVYTGNLVKKLTGKTFSKLLQSKRCSVASQQLLNTDLPVETIIDSVGYENESFFRKIFKEKYGKNPLEYRKREVK